MGAGTMGTSSTIDQHRGRPEASPDVGSLASAEDLWFPRLADPVLVVNPVSLQILDANPAAVALYEFSRPEMVQLNLLDLCVEEDRTPLKALFLEGKEDFFVIRQVMKSGRRCEVEASRSRISWKATSADLWVIRDLAKRAAKPRASQETSVTGGADGAMDSLLTDSLAVDSLPIDESGMRTDGLFRTVINNTSDIIIILDDRGILRFQSPALESKLGYAPEELLGRCAFDFVHPDDLEGAIAGFRHVISDPSAAATMELRLKHKNEEWRLFEAVNNRIEEGFLPGGLVCSFRDITERKEAEEALVESESKFRAVAETATCAIYIHDIKRFFYVNSATVKISGYSREELLGMNPFGLLHADDHDLVMRRAIDRQNGKKEVPSRYEYRILTKSGETRWVDFSASNINFEGKSAIIATAFDITERKRAEQLQLALYEIAERANSDEDLGHLFFGIHEALGKLMYAKNFYIALADEGNETLQFPYFVDEFGGQSQTRKIGKGLTEYVLRTGEPLLVKPSVLRALVKQGDIERMGAPCIDWVGAPLKLGARAFGVLAVQSYDEQRRYHWKEAEILNFVSQHVAIAIERKRNQEALRASEQRYRSLVQSAVYGMYRSSVDGHFLDVNPALVSMLGYDSAEELLSVNLSADIYVESEERERLVAAHRQAHTVGAETKWKRKDGRMIMVRLSGRRVMDEKGKTVSFEMIAEDITERRALEAQLRQSQKMEAVGRLAGGVAHDFNNLLTVIKGYSDLMLDELPERAPLRAEVDEIKKAADRAATLVRQLLAFSRQQVLAPKVIGLNLVIGNMDKLLRRLLGEGAQLKLQLDSALGNVKADPGQIEQVIMNLVVNARDAMPRGGKVIVETANVRLDEAYLREHVAAEPGSYVMIAVSDAGIGMTPDIQSRIFEPFFTTKEIGKGTGLGLSTVYGIVKQSGGFIWCYSEPEIGTTFKVYLPRVDACLEAPTFHRSQPILAGTETVLLVEDEDGVRALVRQVLCKYGYTVLEASHGAEALLLCERYEGTIDLLLTDVVLEQMSGRELATHLMPMRPMMRVLYVSGYTDDAIVQHGVLSKGTAFLQKPFNTESLTAKVREVLDMKIDR